MKCLKMDIQKVQYLLWFALFIIPAFSLDSKDSGHVPLKAAHQEDKGSGVPPPQLSPTKFAENNQLFRELLENQARFWQQMKEIDSELTRLERAADIINDKVIPAWDFLNRLKRDAVPKESNSTNKASGKPVERSAKDNSKSVPKEEQAHLGNKLKSARHSPYHHTTKIENKDSGHIKHFTKRNATHDKIKGETAKEHHEHEVKVTKRSDLNQKAKVFTDVPLVKKAREAEKNLTTISQTIQGNPKQVNTTEKTVAIPIDIPERKVRRVQHQLEEKASTARASVDRTTASLLRRKRVVKSDNYKNDIKTAHVDHCRDCSHHNQPKTVSSN